MKVKNFTLPASNGENISLSDFSGKNVVLYFYPKDNTPGCSKEACSFRDFNSEFQDSDTVILGVSKDSLKKHSNFIEKFNLPFLLLSDENGEVCELYGVWKLKKNYGKEYMGIERSTFLIDKNGELVKEWRKVKVADHVEEVLEYIKNNLG
jgi:peroxiredoxin Q/BCP